MAARTPIPLSSGQSAALTLILGAAALVYEGVSVTQLIAARNWPSTRGTVTSSSWMHSGSDRQRTARPRIVYEYSVNGQPFTNSKLRYGGLDWIRFSPFSADSAGVLDAYPPGKAVTVHYDSQDPATAVLELNLPWTGYATVFAGFALALFGTLRLWGARSARAVHSPPAVVRPQGDALGELPAAGWHKSPAT